MAGQPLEIAGGVKRTLAGAVDPYYDNDGAGWATLAAAKAGVPTALRLRKSVLIDGLGEYWWKDGTTDDDLIIKGAAAGAAATRLYENGQSYSAGQLIYNSLSSIVLVIQDFTANYPTMVEHYHATAANYTRFVSRRRFVETDVGVTGQTTTTTVNTLGSHDISRILAYGNATINFTTNVESFRTVPFDIILQVKAGAAVTLTWSDDFKAPLPVIPTAVHTQDTIYQIKFMPESTMPFGTRKFLLVSQTIIRNDEEVTNENEVTIFDPAVKYPVNDTRIILVHDTDNKTWLQFKRTATVLSGSAPFITPLSDTEKTYYEPVGGSGGSSTSNFIYQKEITLQPISADCYSMTTAAATLTRIYFGETLTGLQLQINGGAITTFTPTNREWAGNIALPANANLRWIPTANTSHTVWTYEYI